MSSCSEKIYNLDPTFHSARDEPPVANAGRDYEIRLPTDSVTLDGSRSTDDNEITSYRWNVLSGNTRGIDVSGDNSPMLRLDNLNEGEYRVRLTVSDKMRQTDTDEARIVVKPGTTSLFIEYSFNL